MIIKQTEREAVSRSNAGAAAGRATVQILHCKRLNDCRVSELEGQLEKLKVNSTSIQQGLQEEIAKLHDEVASMRLQVQRTHQPLIWMIDKARTEFRQRRQAAGNAGATNRHFNR